MADRVPVLSDETRALIVAEHWSPSAGAVFEAIARDAVAVAVERAAVNQAELERSRVSNADAFQGESSWCSSCRCYGHRVGGCWGGQDLLDESIRVVRDAVGVREAAGDDLRLAVSSMVVPRLERVLVLAGGPTAAGGDVEAAVLGAPIEFAATADLVIHVPDDDGGARVVKARHQDPGSIDVVSVTLPPKVGPEEPSARARRLLALDDAAKTVRACRAAIVALERIMDRSGPNARALAENAIREIADILGAE